MGDVIPLVDHFYEAQKAAEAHMAACWEYLEAEDAGALDPAPELDLMAPFCGCETCVVREILHVAEPHLRRAWEQELRELAETGPVDG